jgi:hypothetical protein
MAIDRHATMIAYYIPRTALARRASPQFVTPRSARRSGRHRKFVHLRRKRAYATESAVNSTLAAPPRSVTAFFSNHHGTVILRPVFQAEGPFSLFVRSKARERLVMFWGALRRLDKTKYGGPSPHKTALRMTGSGGRRNTTIVVNGGEKRLLKCRNSSWQHLRAAISRR